MSKFKIGDRVKIVSGRKSYQNLLGLGKVGTITAGSLQERGYDYGYDYVVGFDDGSPSYAYYHDEMELIAPKPARRLTVKPGTPVTFGTDGAAIFEGDFEFEVADLRAYVQVKAGGWYSPLTYIDPSGSLAVGDPVIVPLGSRNKETLGSVVALGRGTYRGPAKGVIAKLIREEIAA